MTRRIASRISILLALAAAAAILVACASSTTTAAVDTEDASSPAANNDAGDAEAGFGCCPLPESPPTCASMTNYGGSKRFANDSCRNETDAVFNPTLPGWKVTNDESGCPTWTPPEAAGFVSCQHLDASFD